MVSSNSRFQRRIGRHRLLVEQLLDAILELIRLVLADVLNPRPVVPERRVRHRGFELLVVEPVELELEEQQMDRRRRDPLLHVAVEFRARRIDRVAGMHEARERTDPSKQIVERLVALHRLGERRSGVGPIRNGAELALVVTLERKALGIAAIEVALHIRIVDPGVEVGEIPFRQLVDTGFRGGFGGGLRRRFSGLAGDGAFG